MNKSFFVDSMSSFSCNEIKNHLITLLEKPINENRAIIFLCIGTDRSTGDSLGPLVGYKLKSFHKDNIYVYGTLETPVHSKNLVDILNKINKYFQDPFIVSIDASLGNVQNIGKVFIDEKPLTPGLALNKDLPSVGNISITGIVNISGNLEFIVLQNTRLFTVMSLADCISGGISLSLKELTNKNLSDNSIKFLNNNK